MEVKKSSNANLEKDISLNYLMGIVIALAVLFVGFEWGDREVQIVTSTGFAVNINEEEIDASEQLDEPPPPVVEPEAPKDIEIINIVEDNIEVAAIDFSSEDTETHAQQEVFVASSTSGIVEKEEVYDPDEIFTIVEKDPEFPGGYAALMKWFNETAVYPTIASENGIQGRVNCQFVVNIDGSVQDIVILSAPDPSLAKEAERVLKKVPKFKPGEQRGKPVRVRYNVGFRFQLEQAR